MGKFDPDKGFYCSNYVTWRIRQNIERVLMNQKRIIRLSVFLEKALKVFVKVKRRFSGKYTKDRSPKLVAADSEVYLAEVNRTLKTE